VYSLDFASQNRELLRSKTAMPASGHPATDRRR